MRDCLAEIFRGAPCDAWARLEWACDYLEIDGASAGLDALTEMGLLDDPGAEVYEYVGGRWVNRTKDLRSWVKD